MKADRQRGALGTWVRRERLSHGWTVEDLAAAVEVQPSTIRGIEAGTRPPGRLTVDRLAQAFGSEPPSLEAGPSDTDRIVEAVNLVAAQVRGLRDDLQGGDEDIDPAILDALTAAGLDEYEARMAARIVRRRK